MDVLASYVRYCERRGFSAATIRSYRLCVTLWLAYLDELGIDQPGPAEAETFLSQPEWSPKSRAGYQSWLSPFCKWAYDEGIYDRNPCAKLHRQIVPDTIPKVISEAALERALQTEIVRLRLWLLLAAKAGLRRKEIAGVRGEDVRLDGARPMLVVSNPKGRRQRTVPLSADTVAAFKDFGLHDGYLFPGTDHGHILPDTVGAHIGAHLRYCGIDVTAHALRHRYASRLYALTLDLRYVQECLGHQNPATTVRYTHLDNNQYGTEIDQL